MNSEAILQLARECGAKDYTQPPMRAVVGLALREAELIAFANAIRNAALEEAAGIASNRCEKCGGEGWLWGEELDNPDEDTRADSMTKYSCDGVLCECAAAIREKKNGTV